MIFYRYEANETHEPALLEFRVINETTCGYWISDFHGIIKKWVSKTGKKRYAYPTKDEAFESYLIRKMRYVKNCRIIVELCKNVWLADWDGDPGRTLHEENAKVFTTLKSARAALLSAREFHPFLSAEIKKVSSDP